MPFVKKIGFVALGIVIAASVIYLYQNYRPPRHWDATGQPQNELKVLRRAMYYVQNNYVAPDQLKSKELLEKALHIMQQGLAPVMVHWQSENTIEIEVAGQARRFQVPLDLSLNDLAEFLGHIVDFVEAKLPQDDSAAAEENIEYLLISGVVLALDPHSSFLRPRVFSEFKIGTTGNFGGVGIAIGIRDGYLTVITPLEGTPAYRVGIKAQDRIIQIDDDPTINMSLTEAVERLRGNIGTTVSVLIRRGNIPDPLPFTIRRALITIDSVKAQLFPEEKIALVKVKNFQEDTLTEFHRHVRELARQANGLNGIILDLRNNPGGLLDQSVALADAFLKEGVIVSTVGLNNQLHEEDRARDNDIYEEIPIVVLVNEGSASASEILAGALQVHNRAIVLGNKTFGKGTVQTLYDLKDGSALKLTIAKYLAAGTEDVQASGIVPDVLMVPVHVTEEVVDLIENEQRREHDLEKRFEHNSNAPPAEPAFKLPYVASEEKVENITGTVQLSHDFPVELARHILTLGQSSTRKSQLDIIEKSIDELRAEQDEKLSAALQKQGINWTVGEASGTPKAEIQIWFTLDDKKIEHLKGGEEVKMHISVKNSGDGAFYRLLAVTNSENPLLSDLEFPLGRIEPEQIIDYTVPISLPASIPGQELPLKVTFREHYENVPAAQSVPILITPAPDPDFTYSWRLKQNIEPLPTEQDIELILTIKNNGEGDAQEPVLNLGNREGSHVVLKKGRVKLDPIRAGESVEASLTIRLKPDIPLDEARMTISIEDRNSGYMLRDQLTLASSASDYSPPMNEWQRPPAMVLERPDNPYRSTKKKYRFSGQAIDDDTIKEIYVFANFDKIYYESIFNDSTDATPFAITVLLEPGANHINVLTKDRQGLITRQRWIVWREES